MKAVARSVPGTLRQEILVDGRHPLTTDQPARAGGDDAGPSPHELLPAGLGACIAWALVRYAQTKDWDLGDVTVAVDFDHRAAPRRFEIDIELTGDLTDEQLERLEKVAAACPLRRSLEAKIEFEERVRSTRPLVETARADP